MSSNAAEGHHQEAVVTSDAPKDTRSLKEVVLQAHRHIDVGAAVLPKLLFDPCVDGDGSSNQDEPPPIEVNDENRGSREEPPSDEIYAMAQDAATPPTLCAQAVQREFNCIVLEHHLKWSPLCVSEPGPLTNNLVCSRLGRYDFHHCDVMVDWAIRNGIKVKGHVLVWHQTSPIQILERMSDDHVAEMVRRHIFTTMGHFRGRIQTWDVVNEALDPQGELADTIFHRKLGADYIERCFRWAHEADPTAILLYNDNKVEGMDGPNKRKADGFYRLLADLKRNGCPVHGCGMQAHFNAAGTGNKRPPTPRMVKNQIRRLGHLGLSVNISEMDVRVMGLPRHLRSLAQIEIYRDILAAALTEPAFDGIWVWGVSDKHSWVPWFYRTGDTPLLLDASYARKPAYYAVREALLALTPGGSGLPWDGEDDMDPRTQQPWGSKWMQPEPAVEPSTGTNSQQQQQANGASKQPFAGDARPDWEIE